MTSLFHVSRSQGAVETEQVLGNSLGLDEDKKDLAVEVHTLVTPRLDYGNVLCVGLLLKTIQKIRLVQNSVTRMLTGVGCRGHITPDLELAYLKGHVRPYELTQPLQSDSNALL